MARQRRKFTEQYKRDAVRLAKESDKSVNQVARDLDLTVTALRRWIVQYEVDSRADPAGPLTTGERDELRDLRKRVRDLEMEREILKKATAFFAKESK